MTFSVYCATLWADAEAFADSSACTLLSVWYPRYRLSCAAFHVLLIKRSKTEKTVYKYVICMREVEAGASHYIKYGFTVSPRRII